MSHDQPDEIPTWSASSLGSSAAWPDHDSWAETSGAPARAASSDQPPQWEPALASSFGEGTASTASVGAPKGWLVAGAVVGLAALLLGLQASLRPGVAAMGWVLGGFGCMGILVAFTVVDVRRQADPAYTHRDYVKLLRVGLLLLAASATALNAWQFADFISRTRTT